MSESSSMSACVVDVVADGADQGVADGVSERVVGGAVDEAADCKHVECHFICTPKHRLDRFQIHYFPVHS